ncbi:TetR/AcrR family transcriptional regulator [Pseudomonas sp.]|uniref:TetR/AcrR family transcriptional regulator n=1 Tax=Pseudomonas sp. TaxID=306 RepID=UPI00356A41B7
MNSQRARCSFPSALLACSSEAPASRLEQIRYKALELFAERGFARVSMRELAIHVEIGCGSLYHHFESKERLLFELIEELYDDLLEAVFTTSRGSAHERLLSLLWAHIALHERRGLNFMMAEQEFRCLSPQHQKQIQQMRQRYEDSVLTRLLDAGATGPIRLLRATVQAVIAWLNHLPSWLQQSALEPAERQALIEEIVLGSLSGVIKQPLHDAVPAIVPLAEHGATG